MQSKMILYASVLIGTLLIGIGIYLILDKQNQSTSNLQPSFGYQVLSRKITIPFQNYTQPSWNEYGPGYNGKSFDDAENIWMRARGQISYLVNIPEDSPKGATISVQMCSELEKKVSDDPAFSSDTTLIVNSKELEMKNVIADNGIGETYNWKIPGGVLKTGTNEITFKVGNGKRNNGLTIFSPITVSLE